MRSIGSQKTNVRIIKGNIYEHDFRPYDVIFCNLPRKTFTPILKRFERELSYGSQVIIYNRELKDWVHSETIDIAGGHNSAKLYVYVIGQHRLDLEPQQDAISQDDEHEAPNKEQTKPLQFMQNLILGHRGTGVTMFNRSEEEDRRRREGRRFPENTYESCMKALQVGADGVEIDVLATKDNELVVCHDDDLNLHVTKRAGKDLGKISEQSFAEIRNYDIGDGLRIPLLDDILHLVQKYDAVLNIEIKAPRIGKLVVDKINEYSQSFGLNKNNIIISSFDHATLKEVRDLDKTLKIGLLFTPQDEELTPIYPDDPLSPSYRHYSLNYIDKVYPIIHPTSLHMVPSDINEDISVSIDKYNLQLFMWQKDEPKVDKNRENISLFYGLIKNKFPAHLITDYPESVVNIIKRKRDNDGASKEDAKRA
jgi:glycerophosphoryl diester phosphodiesterase